MSAAPAPLFLLGAPFSGLSWLAGQLGGHRELCALPELNLWLADTVGGVLHVAELSQGAVLDGLLRAIAQLEFGAQDDARIEQARAWLVAREDHTTGALLDALAARAAPRRLVIPDSGSPLRPLDLRRLIRACPRAALLHVTRHPWTQGGLLAAWARGRLFVPPDYKDHRHLPACVDGQIPWLRAQHNLERLLQHEGRDAPQRRVRIEDVDDDGAFLARLLASWLGHDGGPAAQASLTRPERWVFAGYGPRSAPYGLEPEVLETLPEPDLRRAFDPRLDAPLPWRDDGERFAPEVRALAVRYGYEPEPWDDD